MLDCSGFFSPLQMASEEKHPCTYLRVGRHKVIKQKLNHAETPALKTSDPIYPRKFMHSPTTTMTEKVANSSNIVAVMNYACTFPLAVCFYSVIPVHSFGSFCMKEDFNIVTDVNVVIVKKKSQCCFAEKTYIVQKLSAPLIYSLEDGIMWIPSLL
jgi:hypothetical protein